MALRLKDFKCRECSKVEEILIVVGDPNPKHCEKTMAQVWIAAPGIDFKRQFNHTLNRKVNSSMELDRELAKTGAWVASKTEANAAYDTDIFDDNATVRMASKEKIRKHVEKQAEALVRQGVLRSTADGWKMGDGVPDHVGATTQITTDTP